MSEWKEYKLGDVINLKRGYDLPNSKRELGVYPIVSSSGITDFHKEYMKLPPGVVTGRYGTIGKVFFIDQPYWPLNTTLYVTDFKGNDPKFIFYFLQSFDFEKFSDKSTVPGINRNHLHTEEVTIPQLPEQKSIASILSSLDDKIDLLHRQNATLEKMAETLFRQWFVEEAKEEWEEKTLEDILEFVVDNRGKTAPTSDSGIPLIATNCIKNNNIFPVYEKVRYVSQDTYDNWFRSHPKPGDIIFVNKGTPGCINLVPEPIDFCIAQDMIALRVDKNLVSNFYLFIYLRLETTQADIINSSVGTTIPHLKKTDLLKFTLPVPPIQLMNKFTQSVEPLFLKMNNNQTQIRTITALRDTLLPKLMSGEVRVEM